MHASQIFIILKIPVAKLKLRYYSTINYVRMQQCSTVFLWLCCVSKTDLQLQRYALHVRIGTILEDKTTYARSLILFGKKTESKRQLSSNTSDCQFYKNIRTISTKNKEREFFSMPKCDFIKIALQLY